MTDTETGEPSAPILFKMHGSIDRKNRKNDSYLITEEDYVDYLGRDQGNYIPPYINRLMQGKNFLFLGYSLEDWNVRVILRKLLNPDQARRRALLGHRTGPQRHGAEGLAIAKSQYLPNGLTEILRTAGGRT